MSRGRRRRPALWVVLADARRPIPYHPGGSPGARDRRDRAALAAALDALIGSAQVRFLDDHDRLIDALRGEPPDLVLNFCNAGFGNRPELQMHVPALLEMLGLPFAGATAACLALCHDKAAVHGLATAESIPVPRQELLRLGAGRQALPRHYPALIKPNDGSGSEGIGEGSLVHGQAEARACLAELARARPERAWAVAEAFLPGREFSLAVLGRSGTAAGLTCLPPLEVDYGALPEDRPQIMTAESKDDEDSLYWRCLALRPAALPDERRQALERHAKRLFERLGCRDYARFDFRADGDGVPRLIDANAHPEWGAEGMVACMAGFAGMRYQDLLARIIDSARESAVAPAGEAAP
jgi:D-alanine-D-alanine ligase